MKRSCWYSLLVFGLALFGVLSVSAGVRGADTKDDGTMVDLDGLKSRTPSEWKPEKPANEMRFMQFRLSRVGEDKADAELIIFKGFGGTPGQNVQRWKAQVTPPEGKTLEEVSKVKELKVGGAPATYLDIHGTIAKMPDYRMLAVHVDGPKNVFHIKLVGPARTVEHYKKGFDEWLMGFK